MANVIQHLGLRVGDNWRKQEEEAVQNSQGGN